MATEASVSAIIANQVYLRGLICRSVANVKKLELKKRTPDQIQGRIETLESNWKKFQKNHDMLCILEPDQRNVLEYFSEDVYEQCQEEYIDKRSELLEYLTDVRRQTGSEKSDNAPLKVMNTPTLHRLPRIDLPKFSGAYREWRHFRDLFISMISRNQDLSNAEKLQYLNMCLKGEAAQLVSNLEITGDNFVYAWQVLVDWYENKRLLINTHLASLFSLPKVNKHSVSDLKTMFGIVKETLGALKALQCPVEAWDHILVFMVTRTLDSESLVFWEQRIGDTTEPATFAELEKFIIGRINALNNFDHSRETTKPSNSAVAKKQVSAKSHQTVANVPKPSPVSCSLCGAAHFLASCQEFRGKTLEQRRDIVKQKNLCFNCLGLHQIRNCRSMKRCRICNNQHHTLIHRLTATLNENVLPATLAGQQSTSADGDHPNQSVAPALPRRDNSQTGPSASTNIASAPSVQYTPVLLATAVIRVTSCYGEQHDVRALLDQGSEVSFISSSLAQRINLPRKKVTLPINGIGAQKSIVSRGLVNLEIVSRIDPSISVSVNAYVLAKLTSYLPPIRVLQNPWPHLQGLELADPDFSSATQIDLVLGAEVYCSIIEEGLRRGGPGSPIAERTSLGWILSGSVSSGSDSHVGCRPAQGLQCSVDHELLDLVQRFWTQEEFSNSSTTPITEAEAQCERYFAETHTRTPEGRYVVRIPKKESSADLGDSYTPALVALKRQERRFATNL